MILSPLSSGKTVEERDIPAFKNSFCTSDKKHLYLLAGVHGDEVEGVYVLRNLTEFLSSEESLEFPMIIVPNLNIDGYHNRKRTNSHGVDLNRNLPAKSWQAEFKKEEYHPGPAAASEPENQFLLELFSAFPPGLILSFHSWKPLLNYNGDCLDVAEFIAHYNHYEIVPPEKMYLTPGSLGDYAPEKYNCPVLTYECPRLNESDKPSLSKIWEENKDGLVSFVRSRLLLKKLDCMEF